MAYCVFSSHFESGYHSNLGSLQCSSSWNSESVVAGQPARSIHELLLEREHDVILRRAVVSSIVAEHKIDFGTGTEAQPLGRLPINFCWTAVADEVLIDSRPLDLLSVDVAAYGGRQCEPSGALQGESSQANMPRKVLWADGYAKLIRSLSITNGRFCTRVWMAPMYSPRMPRKNSDDEKKNRLIRMRDAYAEPIPKDEFCNQVAKRCKQT